MERFQRRGWTPIDQAERTNVFVASSARARLLGLALLDDLPEGVALLLPRCRSVHTFGMRFALDIVFLDAGSSPLHVERAVPPGRVRSCRGARSVLETRAGEADRLLALGLGITTPTARPAFPAGS